MYPFKYPLLIGALLVSASLVHGASVNDSLKVVEKTNQSAIASQKKVDKLALETQRMLEEYQRIVRNTEYQDAYNVQLQQLKANQEVELASLREQLNDINVTQLRILPLILSMADALEKFVILDLPFQQEQRISAVVQLKQNLQSPSLSIPDKYRMVLEAFQVESDYGRTLAAYRDSLVLDGETLSVDFLRVGRVALYYQSLDGSHSGYWDGEDWQALPENMNANIKQAMRVASNQLAPQLLNLPMQRANASAEANP